MQRATGWLHALILIVGIFVQATAHADNAALPISVGNGDDYDSTLLVREDGAWVVVFSRFDFSVSWTSTLWAAVSTDHHTFGKAQLISFGSDPLQAGPMALNVGGVNYLYFMSGDFDAGVSSFYRSAFVGGAFGPAEKVSIADSFTGMYAWLHPALLPDGRVALGFDHYRLGDYTALGDGLSFGTSTLLGVNGRQGRTAAFSDGTMAFTYQNGVNGGDMMVYSRRSTDGRSWTDPAPVTATSTQVHDGYPFARRDGGVDLYYVIAPPTGKADAKFVIYRRQLKRDGTLGIEESLENVQHGNCAQPHPHRLVDGNIFMTYTCGYLVYAMTNVYGAVISTDAP